MTKPEVIVLGIDTTVMDNDEAKKREGVQPTYKKVKGFQPLQVTWAPRARWRGPSHLFFVPETRIAQLT